MPSVTPIGLTKNRLEPVALALVARNAAVARVRRRVAEAPSEVGARVGHRQQDLSDVRVTEADSDAAVAVTVEVNVPHARHRTVAANHHGADLRMRAATWGVHRYVQPVA